MRLLSHHLFADGSPYDEIQDPVCTCTHPFTDHERYCDLCDCVGFDPALMPKQVEYVCSRRAFDRKGKSENPAVYTRHDGEMVLKVYFAGPEERISKVEFNGETRQGWDGLMSLLQTFGD